MKIIKGKAKFLNSKALSLFEDHINLVLNKKDKANIAFPGGRSITGILKKLENSTIPWNKTNIFFIDERIVDPKSNLSNSKLINDFLIKPLEKRNKLTNKNKFLTDKEYTLRHYNNNLKKKEGKFDIAFIGVGEDGHIASLFPKSKSLTSNSHYFIRIKNSPKKPSERISASPKLIKKTDLIFLLFYKGKEEAFTRFLDKRTKVDECPAKLLQNHKNLVVLVEQ